MLLETPRLVLRRFTPADAEFIVELLNSPGWHRFIGDRGVRTPTDALGYLERAVFSSYERWGFGLYHVAQRSDGAAVGMCGLLQRDSLDIVDLGFAFLPAYAGRGYASESARRVLAHARDDFSCREIAGLVQADNAASIRVLEKLGLRHAGPVQLPNGIELQLYRGPLA